MKFSSVIALAAAFTLGAAASQMLRAQSKPPAYQILEVDVSNRDAYLKDFAPLATRAVNEGGGRALARGGATFALDGAEPKRVVVNVFDSFDQAKATLTGPAYLSAKKIGDKYATFRSYIVEGLAK